MFYEKKNKIKIKQKKQIQIIKLRKKQFKKKFIKKFSKFNIYFSRYRFNAIICAYWKRI